MSPEESRRKERHARIRWIKKLMRPLPRRSNIHRYPVLKYFAATARKSPFLWTFKRRQVIPAIYIGCVLALLPLYGLQLILAFILCMISRTNLIVMSGLQFITNPFTAIPLYISCYHVGHALIPDDGEIHEVSEEKIQAIQGIKISDLWNDFGGVLESIPDLPYMLGAMSIGGVVIGLGVAIILHIAYVIGAKRAARLHFPKLPLKPKPKEKETDAA